MKLKLNKDTAPIYIYVFLFARECLTLMQKTRPYFSSEMTSFLAGSILTGLFVSWSQGINKKKRLRFYESEISRLSQIIDEQKSYIEQALGPRGSASFAQQTTESFIEPQSPSPTPNSGSPQSRFKTVGHGIRAARTLFPPHTRVSNVEEEAVHSSPRVGSGNTEFATTRAFSEDGTATLHRLRFPNEDSLTNQSPGTEDTLASNSEIDTEKASTPLESNKR